MKLVLLPGLDGTGLLFKPFIEVLPQNIDVLIISYPKDKKQDYGELVNYVLPQLPKEDYILLGESFSGNVAYQIACRNPKHLKKIIFIASFLSRPRPFLLKIINLLPSKILFLFPPPSIAIKLFMLGFSADKNIIQLFLEALKQVTPEVLSFRLKEINKIKPSLEKYDIKSYYIQATDDYLVPAKSVEEFKRLFSSLNIYRVSGAHFILQSNPVECAKIIENAIK